MEQFVLGIFQEQLSKFIVGFRKEQINANLLNGKGEIKDVALNCSILNQQLATVTPFVELESVQISRLSFHVTSWTNIRKAPILVDIEDVKATILEPMYYLDRTRRKSLKQVSRAAFIEMIREALYKPRSAPYNLFDRIADNLTIEIRSVQISFQPWGKFKTRRIGPWTPPTLIATLRHIRIASVDEYGHEGTPEEVWSHNHHPPNQPAAERSLLLFKKISFECDAGISYPGVTPTPPPLLSQAKVEVHVAIQRRLRDGAILSVQIDATLPKVEIEIPNAMVPTLAHALSGVQYCFSKDRAFEDPLLAKSASSPNSADGTSAKVEVSVELVMDDEVLGGDDDEDDEVAPEVIEEEESFDENVIDESLTSTAPSPSLSRASSSLSAVGGRDHPVLIMPNGLVIYDRVTLSLAVHHCTIRGTYSTKGDGYVQLITKGLIAEVIWPKGKEKGGYAQASLSYVSLQERHGPRIRSILVGGILHESNGPLERPGNVPRGVAADENFPLYENRSLRDDPLDLRHSFPAQAFGLKTTVNFIDKVSNSAEEDIVFVHEVGVDKFDIVLDTDAWCRAFRFAFNEDGGGFDSRWHSGDWSECLSTDMLVRPGNPLNLVDHLQPARQMLLDDNELISSDLLNITAKVTNIEIRIPAAIKDDVRSCDIVFKVDETLLLVSSALPRTFLTGKIGSSINGDSVGQKVVIDFPNDETDIVYAMEKMEDPSIRQSGFVTSRVVSTFRLQLTVRGLSARITPVIPFCDAKQPQQLLAPIEMTMIICFEGEPPKSPSSNLIKIVFFVSVLIHRLHINCDFDLIAGAASTLLHHADVLDGTIDTALRLFRKVSVENKNASGVIIESDGKTKIRKSFQGRRVLVKRQIARSRETGGFSIAFCLQLAEFSFQLWRQHVPLSSPLRHSHQSRPKHLYEDSSIPLIKLLEYSMKGLEVGVEGDFRAASRRVVLKCCLSSCNLQVCDFGAEVGDYLQRAEANSSTATVNANNDVVGECASKMVDVLCFDSDEALSTETRNRAQNINDFLALRLEDCVEQSRSICFACDVGTGGFVSLRLGEIEALALLIIEALLMPTWSRSRRALKIDTGISFFPDRSVGALLASLASTGIRVLTKGGVSNNSKASDKVEQSATIGQVDMPFTALLTSFVAQKVQLALVRFRVVNLIISVPNVGGKNGIGLHLHDLQVLLGVNTANHKTAMMSSAAGKGISWEVLFEGLTEGPKYKITSRQSLHSMVNEGANAFADSTILPEFELSLVSSPPHNGSAVDESESFNDIESLFQLLNQASTLSQRFQAMKGAMLTLLSVMSSERGGGSEFESNLASGPHPLSAAATFSTFGTAVQSCQMLLQRIRGSLEAQSFTWRQALIEKQSEINKIRYVVFEKERDRIGALALVSAQVAGWVRVGGFHVSGQRTLSSATLWPHFAVLRKSLLFLFESEKEYKPRDIVILRGAKLRQLAGGRRRDIRRGFAIIEATGVTRVLTVSNDTEFVAWTQGLRRAIDLDGKASFSVDQQESSPDCDVSYNALLDHPQLEAKSGVIARRSFQLGKKLISGAVQVAKSKGQAVAQKRIQQKSASSEIVGDSQLSENDAAISTSLNKSDASRDAPIPTSETADTFVSHGVPSEEPKHETFAPAEPSRSEREQHGEEATTRQNVENITSSTRGQQLRGRFSGLRQVTKNKLGSAVQAAKQKGLEVAEKRLQQWRHHAEDSKQQTHIENVPTRSGSIQNAPQVAQRFSESSSASLQATESNSMLSWSCGSCTFLNTWHFQVCDMCGASREDTNPNQVAPTAESMEVTAGRQNEDKEVLTTLPVGFDQGLSARQSLVSSADQDDASLVSDLASEDGEHGRRRRMRDRLGAAVRSVRSIALQKEADGGSRIRLGSNYDHSAPTTGSLQTVKLKGIGIGKELTPDDLNVKTTLVEIPLKKLEGHWIVHVTTPPDNASGVANVHALKLAEPESQDFNGSTESPYDQGVKDAAAQPAVLGSLTAEVLEGMTISAVGDSFKPEFLVQLFKQDSALALDKNLFSETRRNFADVYALHTSVSEAVSDYVLFSSASETERDPTRFEMGPCLSSRLGLSPLDTIRFTGKLLAGLLEAPKHLASLDWDRYKCAVVTDFLQSILDSPLPVDALAALEDFLELGSVHIENAGVAVSAESESPPTETENSLTTTSDFIDRNYENRMSAAVREILAMTSVCQTELYRVQVDAQMSQGMGPSTSHLSLNSPARGNGSHGFIATIQEPLLPPSVLEDLHEAMHSALMKVMAERDEAHAQLIAANVLHVHEMGQERKKADHLAKQLELAQKLLKSANGGPLFGNEDKPDEHKANLKRYQDQMTQNVEAELLSLCQQLAGEISARTAAELEIIRLKESRKLERDGESAEKQALRNELKRVKETLSASKNVRVQDHLGVSST